MKPMALPESIVSLPKTELHLHLEGAIHDFALRTLLERYGMTAAEQDWRKYLSFRTFPDFLEAFKWVTSFLRAPEDYALVVRDLAERLLEENVTYAEITLSVGVMLLRRQQPEANLEALLRATEPFERRGLRLRWIFDAVRQFGAEAAMTVVESARSCASKQIVAFGIGGDERSVPTSEFRAVYDRAREIGLRALMHAGETGGPEKIREAIEILDVERIGHGISAVHDRALMDLLAERKIALEICPTSNLRTGALALQLGRQDANIQEHPLPKLFRHGIPVVLSTDDPAIFRTSLQKEYAHAASMGFQEGELKRLVEMGFEYAFSPAIEGRAA